MSPSEITSNRAARRSGAVRLQPEALQSRAMPNRTAPNAEAAPHVTGTVQKPHRVGHTASYTAVRPFGPALSPHTTHWQLARRAISRLSLT